MDLRSIRYFVQIAELGSITRAAGQLGVAQPALSRHVHSIEDELGVQLLVRLPRGVRLTGAGRQFLEHCRRILRELGRARDELRASTEVPSGTVILGVSPTVGPLLVPGIVERARRHCPQISLRIVEGFSTQLYDALLTGRTDVAVLTNPVPSRALNLTPLISEPVVVLAAPQPRGTRRSYTLAELSKTPVIISEGIRSVVEEQINRYGAHLNVEVEIDAIEAIRRLLLRGIGTTIMPVSTFHDDISAGKIAAIQIADANLHRNLVLAQQAERRLSAAVEEISQVVAAEVNALFDLGIFSLPAAYPLAAMAPGEAERPIAGRRQPGGSPARAAGTVRRAP
jgi:LysR family transcriptional regulator, nitrogen assimilation regulatory protein